MRYAKARLKTYQRDEVYRIYFSEGFRVLTLNTAHFAGGEVIDKKIFDIFHPVFEEERTGEEIVADVFDKIGIEVK